MLHIGVCEDSQRDLNVILDILKEYQLRKSDIEIVVKAYSSPRRLIEDVENGMVFGLLILDVLLPGCNGIDLADYMHEKGITPLVIFTTTSPDFALQAFSVNAVQYLVKPIDKSKLLSVIDEVVNYLQINISNCIAVNTKSGIVRINFHNIMMAELSNHVVYIKLTNGTVVVSKTMREPFSDYIKPLCEDKRFIRPHHSFVLNMRYIVKMTIRDFEMSDGTVVAIAKNKLKESRELFMDYISEQRRFNC